MNRKKTHGIIITVLFTIISVTLNAQIEIRPLDHNPVLVKDKKKIRQHVFRADSKWDTVSYDLDKKDFFDDFSYNDAYPSDSFWLDDDAFVNNSLAIRPVSIGVVTFDGLDELGNPYDPGVINSKGKVADYLTSVPIDLQGFQESDSIYLSFFFQPQGLGDAPEYYDSLVLEFKPDSFWTGTFWNSEDWLWRWSIPGSGTHDFTQVFIKVPKEIRDTNNNVIANFYHERFQFRFKNYAALDGNRDLWHLDYVYLDKGRTIAEKKHNDLAINELPNSILDDYTSMPWDHVLADDKQIRNTYNIHTWNNWRQFRHLTAQYFFIDQHDQDTLLIDLTADDKDIYPGGAILPIYFTMEDDFPLNDVTNKDTVVIRSILRSAVFDDRSENNIAITDQEFVNYYAYDDGIPEMGFGFTEGTRYGMVAYKFQMPDGFPATDSLRGVKIFFNQSSDNTSTRAFNIMVWKNYEDQPLLIVETNIPNINTKEANGYYDYIFDTTIYIDGTFYIGWEQLSSFYINIGYDKNYYLLNDTLPDNQTNGNIRAYYGGSWKKVSNATGALMIRPIFDDHDVSVSIKDPVEMTPVLQVYPNPASQYLSINTSEDIGKIEIQDIQGKRVMFVDYNQKLDIGFLEKGVYIIRAYTPDEKILGIERIIKY